MWTLLELVGLTLLVAGLIVSGDPVTIMLVVTGVLVAVVAQLGDALTDTDDEQANR